MKRKHHLLIECYSQDTPAIAVLADVDMSNLPHLKALITEALMDHYDVDTVTCDDIPAWVSDQSYPEFSVGFEVNDGHGDQYAETVNITPVAIYR